MANPNLVFESGQHTTNPNLFTIIKMGLVLKTLTQGAPSSIDEEEESKGDESQQALKQREHLNNLRNANDPEWREFCNGPLHYYETKWTKKLEESVREREEAAAAIRE